VKLKVPTSAKLRCVVSVLTLNAGFLTQTLAQTADAPNTGTDSLAAIIVTAQKRSENLQDVPIAITAVTREQLQSANLVTANDLPTLVSGLSIGDTSLYFQPHLRGIGTAAFGAGIENPVALYVDGVYYPSQLEAPTDLADVSQISVLKGPQGTLFGRNATGGVIQMTTRDPQQNFGGDVQTSIDNYVTSRNYLYLTGGVARDVAANLSVRYTTQGDGWGRNVYNGDPVERDNKDLAARSKWVFTPSDDTTVRLSMDYANISNSLGGNFSPAPGSTPLFPGYTPSANPYDVDTYQTGRNHDENGGISLELQHSLGFADFVGISSFRSYNFYENLVVSLTPVPGININDAENGRDITQELQLVSNKNGAVQWATGVFYFRNEASINPVVTELHGLLAPTPFSFGAQEVVDTLTTESVAPYAQATIELTSRAHVTLGVRDTWEERKLNGSINGFLENGTPIGLLAPYFDNESIRLQLPSYRAAIDYKLVDGLMAYVSYNRSFKSGGFNANNPANAPYLPEILNAYEIGLKSELLDHRLRLNLAPFYYDYKNIQETNYIGALANFYNGAAAKLYGIDLDANFQVTKSFKLSATAEALHSSFSSFPAADFSTPLPTGGIVQYVASAAGNKLPYAPQFTADISGDYIVSLPVGRLDFNVTDEFNSGFFTEADNRLRQPAYDLLNTSVAWTSADDRTTVKLWGRNLLNRLVESEDVTGPPEGYTIDYSNPPRTYGVTVLYKFGAQM
jgi:iron complex outermembrane recepter protein